jgi:hypothetical protein
MRFFTFFLLMTLSIGLLAGCAANGGHDYALTPVPEDPADPTDAQMRQAVMAFLKDSGAPVASEYEFKRVDMDGDRRRDALVLFRSPYGYWCGKDGCTMLVLHARQDDFTLVSSIVPVREPLYVSAKETNGWRDIIVHVSGRWTQTKDVAMQFDGRAYPPHPDHLPAYMQYASNEAMRIF